jgi:membrane protein implicated in regulation of membrane protease activity
MASSRSTPRTPSTPPTPPPGGGRAPGDPGVPQTPSLRLLRIGAALLGAEALVLVVGGVVVVSRLGAAGSGTRLVLGLGLFVFLFALLLVLAVRSLLRRTRFGVGWGVTWQLFQALLGASMLRSGMILPGAVCLVLAVAAFVPLTRIARTAPLPDAVTGEGQGRDRRSGQTGPANRSGQSGQGRRSGQSGQGRRSGQSGEDDSRH